MANRHVEVKHHEVAQSNIGTCDGARTEDDPAAEFYPVTDQRARVDEGQEICAGR
jgi:hypothetical protein